METEHQEAFEAQVRWVRESGLLGRSQGLARLFDYLADPARRGRTLTEADVAQDVFGRRADLAGDASVRVYVHRLRRKLEAFYVGPGRDAGSRLSIPVGEYRLILAGQATEPSAAGRPARRRPVRLWLGAAVAVLLLANLLAWATVMRDTAPTRTLARTAETPLWRDIGADRPVLVVVGDYYIFGDTGGGREPRRMIREFDINAPADLDALVAASPTLEGRYIDLDTYYVPVGATLALRYVLPLVQQSAGDAAAVTVVTASHLTPVMLKNHDIVYVGYLSGLRLLREPVFARSRYQIGQTFDEIVDSASGGTVFLSSAGQASGARANRDYGYIAKLETPAGNRLLVVAGGRDLGVAQMAELASDRRTARTLGADGRAFEALFEVQGMGRTPLGARPMSPRTLQPQGRARN